MSTSEQVTRVLLAKEKEEKAKEISYEEIEKEHFQQCQKFKELGLIDEDISSFYSKNNKSSFASMLKSDRIKFLRGLEGIYSEKLEHIVNELNENLRSCEVVFKLYYNNILSVSIYGQVIYKDYLEEICKNFIPIEESYGSSPEKIIKLVNDYKQDPNEDCFQIENLKRLAGNFKNLFVKNGVYYKDVTRGEQAAEVLPGQKGLTILTPYREPGFHIRMYIRNSQGVVQGFTLGFNLNGKVTFAPDWIVSEKDEIILNNKKERIIWEYDSVGDLIGIHKKYFIFELERDKPDNFSDKQLTQWIKKEYDHLQEYKLLGYPQASHSVESHSQNCCAM